MKENVTKKSYIDQRDIKDGGDIDRVDKSVIRPFTLFKQIFTKAGFVILDKFYQEGFPSDLYDVRCFILAPNRTNQHRSTKTYDKKKYKQNLRKKLRTN